MKSRDLQLATTLKDFNAISVPELVDNSHNKATMVDELNAGVEIGNWSDRDIVIAYVHLSKYFRASSKIHIPFQVGRPDSLWEEFCRFSLSSLFDWHFNTRSKFIEMAAGIEGLSRGGLGSGTKEISVFKFPFPALVDSSICLVDTPGIDGRERELGDVFDMICVWFNDTYVPVLYLIAVEPLLLTYVSTD